MYPPKSILHNMIIPLNVTENRFYQAFDRLVSPAGFFGRLSLPEETILRGERKGNRFFFYCHRKKLFSLFSCTLRGTIRSSQGRAAFDVSFSRPWGITALFLLWSALLAYTGINILWEDPIFSLYFLFPAAGLISFCFVFSRNSKQRLLSALEEMQKTR